MRLRFDSMALIVVVGLLATVMLGSTAHAQDKLTPAEARAIAKEAYIYGFPLVDSYRVHYAFFVDKAGKEFKAPWNQLSNTARVFTSDDRTIQTPNSDTPYSHLGTDLRAEPLVLSVPAMEKERYYSLQFIDAYTFNYAFVGTRATGNEVGHFLLVGPNWKGEKPEGIKAVIRCETEIGWIQFRTHLFNPADIDNVKKIQAAYRVQPLSKFLGQPVKQASEVEFIEPLTMEQQRTNLEFFKIVNFVLHFCPTHPSEKELMAKFARIGVGPGKTFDPATLSPELKKAVEEGMADAFGVVGVSKDSPFETLRPLRQFDLSCYVSEAS
jgi:hypothetical protein